MRENVLENRVDFIHKILFGFVLVAGTAFRLIGLSQRGLYYHDEAIFMRSAAFYGGVIRRIGSIMVGKTTLSSLPDHVISLINTGLNGGMRARPLHDTLLIALSALFGPHDALGLILSALAGIATIILLALLPGRGKLSLPGIIAAGMLAFSTWHVHYSRSALSQALSLMVFCADLFLLAQYEAHGRPATKKRLLFIGLLTGLAFTTHYNLFWLPILVIIWVAWRELTYHSRWSALIVWPIKLGLIMLVPLLLFEISSQIILSTIRAHDLSGSLPGFSTYFQQIQSQVTLGEGVSNPGLHFPVILKVLWGLESKLYLALFVASLIFLTFQAFKKNRLALLLLLTILIPTAIWTVQGYPAPRSFLPILPALCLGTGYLIDNLFVWVRSKTSGRLWKAGFALAFLGSFLVIFQTGHITPMLQARSPWKLACEQIIARTGQRNKAMVAVAEISSYSLPLDQYYLKELVSRDKPNGKLFIIDFTTRTGSGFTEKIKRLESNCQPVLRQSAEVEIGMILEDAFYPALITDYKSGKLPHTIEVYDIRRCTK